MNVADKFLRVRMTGKTEMEGAMNEADAEERYKSGYFEIRQGNCYYESDGE